MVRPSRTVELSWGNASPVARDEDGVAAGEDGVAAGEDRIASCRDRCGLAADGAVADPDGAIIPSCTRNLPSARAPDRTVVQVPGATSGAERG
jgi:hypothetical protein